MRPIVGDIENVRAGTRLVRLTRRFRADEGGFTAVEFAMVALPFCMLLFGTIAVGLFFFTTFSLENAVEKASRQIRTGQAQMATKTTAQFKQDVCSLAPAFVDCVNNLRVNVIANASFSGATAAWNGGTGCTDSSGNLIPEPVATGVTAAASEVVLVTVCYEWEMTKVLPFINLGNMANGSRLIQAATTFKTEPYN